MLSKTTRSRLKLSISSRKFLLWASASLNLTNALSKWIFQNAYLLLHHQLILTGRVDTTHLFTLYKDFLFMEFNLFIDFTYIFFLYRNLAAIQVPLLCKLLSFAACALLTFTLACLVSIASSLFNDSFSLRNLSIDFCCLRIIF